MERRTRLKPSRPPARKARLRPVSDDRTDRAAAMADMRERVFIRDDRCRLAHLAGRIVGDGWEAVIPDCFGAPRTPHHLRKSVHGGPYTLINLLTLCAHHNDWVETEPILGHVLGLVMRRGDTYDEVWGRLVRWGIVDYWWNGDSR